MKHFDLFSGYGGFSLASQKVYGNNNLRPNELADSERPEALHDTTDELQQRQCVDYTTIGFSEIDKYASAVLKYHWPQIKNYGDIKNISWSEVPDFDLLTGGSPCQDLSIAGKRAGLEGHRSGLFYEYMRAVKEKKPKYFIWENVKGTLSSNKGFDFASVLNEMAEAGYSLWWQVLNAKDFGVPQNRERIFVIGFRDRPAPEIFFEREVSGEDTRAMGQEISYALDANYAKGTNTLDKSRRQVIKQLNNPTHSNNRIYSADGEPSFTVNTQDRHGVYDGAKIRRLTPLECERLMGLPDGWTSKGVMNDQVIDISDSQRYKLCGNGVVVNVVEEIIKHLLI